MRPPKGTGDLSDRPNGTGQCNLPRIKQTQPGDRQGEPMLQLMRDVEQMAAETNRTEIEVITDMQAGAAILKDEVVLSDLCALKNYYIDRMGVER